MGREGPQGIMEKVMMEIMFHVPDRGTRGCKKTRIT